AEGVFEVEGPARDDVDRARHAAFHERRFGALVHDHFTNQLGRQQRVTHAAADGAGLVQHEPVAGGDIVTVDQRLREAGTRPAHADTVVLVETALGSAGGTDSDARYAFQRVGEVLVRHLADVFGADDVLHGVRGALRLERHLEGGADSGDD